MFVLGSPFFFFNDTATTEIYTLSLHDALPISSAAGPSPRSSPTRPSSSPATRRSEEHTSELQSLAYIVCRLLLEKKKINHFNLFFFKKKKKQKKKQHKTNNK